MKFESKTKNIAGLTFYRSSVKRSQALFATSIGLLLTMIYSRLVKIHALRRQAKLCLYQTKQTVMKVFNTALPDLSHWLCFAIFPAKTTSCLKITSALYHFVICVDECLSGRRIFRSKRVTREN